MHDTEGVKVDERVVLSKYEGDPVPDNEFERITIHNGEVVAHDIIENGEVVAPVEDSDIIGKDIGYLTQEQEVE